MGGRLAPVLLASGVGASGIVSEGALVRFRFFCPCSVASSSASLCRQILTASSRRVLCSRPGYRLSGCNLCRTTASRNCERFRKRSCGLSRCVISSSLPDMSSCSCRTARVRVTVQLCAAQLCTTFTVHRMSWKNMDMGQTGRGRATTHFQGN